MRTVVLRCRAHGVEPHGKAAPRARDGHFETAFPKLQRVAGVSDDPWAVLAACMGTVQWCITPIARGARLRVAAATESSCEAATAKPAESGCHRVRGICQPRHRAAMSACRHGMLIQPACQGSWAGLGCVVWCGEVWCGVELRLRAHRDGTGAECLPSAGAAGAERAIHCIHDIDIDIVIDFDFGPIIALLLPPPRCGSSEHLHKTPQSCSILAVCLNHRLPVLLLRIRHVKPLAPAPCGRFHPSIHAGLSYPEHPPSSSCPNRKRPLLYGLLFLSPATTSHPFRLICALCTGDHVADAGIVCF
jgi:hypothetical protein